MITRNNCHMPHTHNLHIIISVPPVPLTCSLRAWWRGKQFEHNLATSWACPARIWPGSLPSLLAYQRQFISLSWGAPRWACGVKFGCWPHERVHANQRQIMCREREERQKKRKREVAEAKPKEIPISSQAEAEFKSKFLPSAAAANYFR